MDGRMRVRGYWHRIGFLHIVGKDQGRDAAFSLGDAHGPIDEVPRLIRRGANLHEVAGHVLEQCGEIDLLLEVAAERGARRLANDCYDRLMIELGVIESIQQMDRAWPGRGEANTDLAGELGVAAGHEGSFLLMSHLDE